MKSREKLLLSNWFLYTWMQLAFCQVLWLEVTYFVLFEQEFSRFWVFENLETWKEYACSFYFVLLICINTSINLKMIWMKSSVQYFQTLIKMILMYFPITLQCSILWQFPQNCSILKLSLLISWYSSVFITYLLWETCVFSKQLGNNYYILLCGWVPKWVQI